MLVVLAVLNLLYVFSKRSNFISRISTEKRQALLTRLTYLAEVCLNFVFQYFPPTVGTSQHSIPIWYEIEVYFVCHKLSAEFGTIVEMTVVFTIDYTHSHITYNCLICTELGRKRERLRTGWVLSRPTDVCISIECYDTTLRILQWRVGQQKAELIECDTRG